MVLHRVNIFYTKYMNGQLRRISYSLLKQILTLEVLRGAMLVYSHLQLWIPTFILWWGKSGNNTPNSYKINVNLYLPVHLVMYCTSANTPLGCGSRNTLGNIMIALSVMDPNSSGRGGGEVVPFNHFSEQLSYSPPSSPTNQPNRQNLNTDPPFGPEDLY